MKANVTIQKQVEIDAVELHVPVLHGDEDMPSDYPFRKGDMWGPQIEIDTGRIVGWPENIKANKLYIKVRDNGLYILLDESWNIIASISDDYVPNGVIPGEYGDYIEMDIDENGVILNWPDNPDVSAFFPTGE